MVWHRTRLKLKELWLSGAILPSCPFCFLPLPIRLYRTHRIDCAPSLWRFLVRTDRTLPADWFCNVSQEIAPINLSIFRLGQIGQIFGVAVVFIIAFTDVTTLFTFHFSIYHLVNLSYLSYLS